MTEQGRKTTNKADFNLEKFIEDTLRQLNYQQIEPSKFVSAMYLKQPIYSHKVRYGTNIYGLQSEVDFAIYHPEKHPDGLIIEVKWQQSGGTVDEKFPYLVINIQTKYPYKTIVILDGGGYRKGAEKWIRSEVRNNLIHVFNMIEFQTWVIEGGL